MQNVSLDRNDVRYLHYFVVMVMRLCLKIQSVNLNTFSKYFQQRVNDQYEQHYQSYIKESPRFDIVKLVFLKI